MTNLRDSLEQVTTITECASLLGEGPVWVARDKALYWVDIQTPLIWRWTWPHREVRHWVPPFRIGAIAPRVRGGFVAATENGFALVDLDRGAYELIGNPEPRRPRNRFNDGKVDAVGNFWAGTMDDAEECVTGALYRLAPSLEWSRIDDGYSVANGPAFSPDGRFAYHSDSALRCVYRFSLASDGCVGPREPFLSFRDGEGHPDGMTTDIEGCLWIAFWDGGCVRRFAPDGTPLVRIDLPVQRPTSCAFGGPLLDSLFITSARIGLSGDQIDQQPLAGALFSIEPGVRGVSQPLFAG